MPQAAMSAGPRRWRDLVAALVLCLLAMPASAAEPSAREGRCADAPLRVTFGVEAELAHACEAWRRVSAFLIEGNGLQVAAPIELVFTERVAVAFGAEELRVLGAYDRERRVARITSVSAAWLRASDRLMFGLPVETELYTSLIAHELAHAVLLDNMRLAVPGRVGPEYMAYVVQIETMAPPTRDRVLARYPDADFVSVTQITEAFHLMAPHAFGVSAWRHFRRDGHAYVLDMILTGRAGVDLPP
jgi:hypothetical protein